MDATSSYGSQDSLPLSVGETLVRERGSAKVLSSPEDQLVAPLLQSDAEQERRESQEHSAVAAAINAASSLAMDIPVSDESINSPTNNTMYFSSHPLVRRLLRMSTAADALPTTINSVVTDGKMAAFVFFGVYLVLVLLWLPFWLLTFLIGEIGVYLFMVASVFFLGRVIIR